ncbi:MAG: response regulator [Campylobacterales bacterium]
MTLDAAMLKRYTASLRILYVEDDQKLCDETAALLRLLFKEVKTAADGEAGLELFRFDGPFDLVLTDIYMPKMDGIELTRKIREIDEEQPIVVISAHEESHYLISLINLGVDHFVLKPVEISRMMEVLYKVSRRINDERELKGFHEYLKQRVEEEFSKRRESEALLIQQSKMAVLGEMIGAIAHQWRQPLTALSILLQDMHECAEHGGIQKEQLLSDTTEGLRQVAFMNQTVEDFRSFLKPSKNREPFDVKESLQSVLGLISKLLAGQEIGVEITGGETPAVVTGYPNEFKQALLNLFANATDAINARRAAQRGTGAGLIRIELTRSAGGELSVSFEDNGGGIDAAILGRIFEPYFSTKGESGTGIGLYIAKTIIESGMGGTLTALNTQGGARFEIRLPAMKN